MRAGMTTAVATLTGAAIAALLATGIAHADHVPKVGNACRGSGDSSAALDGSQTFTPQGEVLLCPAGGPMAVWTHLAAIQRPATVWYTYGPPATLTANDVSPGSHWIGFGGTDCSAVQTSTAGGPPVVKPIQAGAPFTDFFLLKDLATLKLTGSCQWRTAGSSPYGP
ncbi:hypothetical protein ACQI5H_17285 [Mycobacterium heidelbergense]|uniref:hypothetical protein n=1 Tax=Mycobacterium heidelbergense TaxID=53376 RepID=UPI003CEAB7DD